MKLRTILCSIAMMTSLSMLSCNDDMSPKSVPADVREAFYTMYPNSRILECEREDGMWVLEFKNNGSESEAWFDGNQWVMTETDISYRALPQAVKNAFAVSRYADWKREDVDMVERRGYETVYVIEVERGEDEADLYFTESGLLVRENLEKDHD